MENAATLIISIIVLALLIIVIVIIICCEMTNNNNNQNKNNFGNTDITIAGGLIVGTEQCYIQPNTKKCTYAGLAGICNDGFCKT
jgi:hypothetical protein